MRNLTRPPWATSFGDALRAWRGLRGLSQLDLAVMAGVSSRHISFLETGRSRASRDMVLRLADSLDVPLRDRNAILVTAGYAPLYPETSLASPDLERVREGLRFLLERHNPYSAYILDASWNIVEGNATHERMLEALLPGASEEPQNALRLLLDPDRLRPRIPNWEEVSRVVLGRLRRQLRHPSPPAGLVALHEEIQTYPGVSELLRRTDPDTPFDVLVPMQIDFGDRRTSWFTTLMTFGAALDVTLQELVVECLFPADDATEVLAREFAKAGT